MRTILLLTLAAMLAGLDTAKADQPQATPALIEVVVRLAETSPRAVGTLKPEYWLLYSSRDEAKNLEILLDHGMLKECHRVVVPVVPQGDPVTFPFRSCAAPGDAGSTATIQLLSASPRLVANLTLPNRRGGQYTLRVGVVPGETTAYTLGAYEATVERESAVPVLGDAPFVGKLFRKRRMEQETRSMILFLSTPEIPEEARE